VVEINLGVLHNNLEHIRKQQTFVRNVIIEGAPHENKMAVKGQITSERVSSYKMIRL
jgi:hypothetical protein